MYGLEPIVDEFHLNMPDLLFDWDDDDDDDDSLSHLWCRCMGPNVALCGSDLTYAEEVDDVYDDDEADQCIVCFDLDKTHPCTKD